MTKPGKTHRLTLLVASSDRSYAGALATALGGNGDIEIRGHPSYLAVGLKASTCQFRILAGVDDTPSRIGPPPAHILETEVDGK